MALVFQSAVFNNNFIAIDYISRVSAVIKISEASGASEYASEMLTLS